MKIITPTFRASYLNIFQPMPDPQGRHKYSVQMLFPKDSTDLAPLKKGIEDAIKTKWGSLEKAPKPLRTPLRDGDVEKEPGSVYEGMWFLSASATEERQPGLVDQKLQAIIDPSAVYSGCWMRAQVSFYAYDKAGNRGVGVGLQNLQLVRLDDRLDGRAKAESAFGVIEEENLEKLAEDEIDIFS